MLGATATHQLGAAKRKPRKKRVRFPLYHNNHPDITNYKTKDYSEVAFLKRSRFIKLLLPINLYREHSFQLSMFCNRDVEHAIPINSTVQYIVADGCPFALEEGIHEVHLIEFVFLKKG
jgi:hypothetical protein